MERVILWSTTNKSDKAASLAKLISKELNVLTEVLTEQECLKRVASLGERESALDSQTLFISSDIPWTDEDILAVCKLAQSYNGQFATFSFTDGKDMASFPAVEASDLPTCISPAQTWCLAASLVNDELCGNIGEVKTMPQTLVRMAIRSIGEHNNNEWSLETINVAGDVSAYESTLNNTECSEVLQYTLSAVNIEDLFPNHSWENHGEESAAACYHTLAARFIAFADHDRAKECLENGDQLEDSPRSLALRGLIALREGEVLTAVANMVSSLQEYEKRKNKTEGHYLTFAPQNLKVINDNLQSGLAALNKKENDAAAGYFTDAVFEFDEFYTKCGLEQPKTLN